MTILIFAIIVFVVWLVLSSRIRRLEDQAEMDAKGKDGESEIIAGLLRRVYALERSQVAPAPVAPEPPLLASPLAPIIVAPIESPQPMPAPSPLPPPPMLEEPQPAMPPRSRFLFRKRLRSRRRCARLGRISCAGTWAAPNGRPWLAEAG